MIPSDISISSTATTGSRDVSVVHTTPGGGSATLSAGFTVDTSPAVSVDDQSAIPERFELTQNYPNPFNPSTTISYALPERCYVKLEVLNVSGQLIAQLVSAEREPGYHQVEWHARGEAATGAYFYRIQATPVNHEEKSFIETKTLLLLR